MAKSHRRTVLHGVVGLWNESRADIAWQSIMYNSKMTCMDHCPVHLLGGHVKGFGTDIFHRAPSLRSLLMEF